ncbi:MAG: serine hydrolase [Bacteroidota bacterium]
MKHLLLVLFTFLSIHVFAQLYFPPVSGNTWETVPPGQLGWCTDRIDSLYKLLEDNNTKGFIILKDGKLVIEKYFGTFTPDSAWYWASAAKSLTAFLTGIAQQQHFLNINDSVSKYLGLGWTSCPPEKERLITIKHQLTMTTGLNYLVADQDCTEPSCLSYKNDAGSFWFYHNAPYHLIHDVIAQSSGKTYQQFTNQYLASKTGITGLWYDHIYYSKPRSMARFGLLMLNKGIWNGDTVLSDANYYNSMINTSQQMNNAYGYLWWLNGKASYKIPASLATFPGKLCPPAPDDIYMALGKNDQKLYVWPSKNIVVVRMGDAASDESQVPITFDTTLWQELNRVMCSEFTGVHENNTGSDLTIWPNPAYNKISFRLRKQHYFAEVSLYASNGEKVYAEKIEYPMPENEIDISRLRCGIYTLRVISGNEVLVKRIAVVR